jgi:hypothetical protein
MRKRVATLSRRERNRTRRQCRCCNPLPIGRDSSPSYRVSLRSASSMARRNLRASPRRNLDHSRHPTDCPAWNSVPRRARPTADLPASDQARDSRGLSRPRRFVRHRGTTATRPRLRDRPPSRDLRAARPPMPGSGPFLANPSRRSRASRFAALQSLRRPGACPVAWSHPRSSGRRNWGCPRRGLDRPARTRRRSPTAPVAHAPRNRDGSRLGEPGKPGMGRPAPRPAIRLDRCATSLGRSPARPGWIGG